MNLTDAALREQIEARLGRDQGHLTNAFLLWACDLRDASRRELVAAAQALDTKLDAMEGPLNSVFGIAQIHSAPYVGPQWTEERQALKAAIAAAGAGKEEDREIET